MKKYLVDTNIISFYLKGKENLRNKISKNIKAIALSIISYYEIVSGFQSINAFKRISEFEDFCSLTEIINLDIPSIKESCKVYADLKSKGELIDDIDILIAGLALSNNLILVTDNVKHFKRVKGLRVENWR